MTDHDDNHDRDANAPSASTIITSKAGLSIGLVIVLLSAMAAVISTAAVLGNDRGRAAEQLDNLNYRVRKVEEILDQQRELNLTTARILQRLVTRVEIGEERDDRQDNRDDQLAQTLKRLEQQVIGQPGVQP